MNELSPTDDLRTGAGDDLDRLLGDFFKAQMKHPWPAAPVVGTAEPSTLATTRDSGNRARYTLAASVALLLGTCWYLSNGFEPGDRQGGNGSTSNPGTVDKSKFTAELKFPTNDTPGNGGFVPPKVKMP